MTEWGIDTLFNPGKRHMDEEKRRLQSTREEVGDSSGGRRIDLESGTVKIARRGTPTADPEANDPQANDIEPTDTEPTDTDPAEATDTDANPTEARDDEAAAEADRSHSPE
jgi:hypothetical protein